MFLFLAENKNYYVIYTDGSKGSDYVHTALYDSHTKFSQSLSFTVHVLYSLQRHMRFIGHYYIFKRLTIVTTFLLFLIH